VSLHDADAARKQMDQSAASDMVRDIAVPPLLGTGSFDAAPMPADVRSAGTHSPREGFAALWFDTLTHDAPTLELLRAHADPSHLMCGSDYPFDMGVTRPLELPRAEGIDDEVPERNARRFLGL
jgi:hypothetical protein